MKEKTNDEISNGTNDRKNQPAHEKILVTIDEFKQAESYWLEKLSGAPGDLEFPVDFPGSGQ